MPSQKVASDDGPRLQDVADILAYSKKVVVITGAGISTNTGIPDFRSKHGLYSLIQSEYESGSSSQATASSSQLQEQPTSDEVAPETSQLSEPPALNGARAIPSNVKGKDLFDSRIWSDERSTSVFYRFIASLRRRVKDVPETTPTHKFICSLRNSGRLVRCYTQNIDGLESRDGLCTNIQRGKGNRARLSKKVVMQQRPEHNPLEGSEMDGGCEVVQLHGDLEDLRCGFCQAMFSWDSEDWHQVFLEGEAPTCPKCAGNDEARQKRGRRSTGIGFLRPNVVLYGEQHPSSHLISEITEHDLSLAPDTLIIMGTSLKVHGLKVLIREFAKAVRCRKDSSGKVIFVNLSKPSESVWGDVIDYWVEMDCDQWIEDLRTRRADIWTKQGDPRPKRKRKRKPTDGTTLDPAKALCNAAAAVREAAQILMFLRWGPLAPLSEDKPTQRRRRTGASKKRKRDDLEIGEDNARNEESTKRPKSSLMENSEPSTNLAESQSDIFRPHRICTKDLAPSTPETWTRHHAQAHENSCDLHMPIPTPPSSARSSFSSYSFRGAFNLNWKLSDDFLPYSIHGGRQSDDLGEQIFPSRIVEDLEKSCSQFSISEDSATFEIHETEVCAVEDIQSIPQIGASNFQLGAAEPIKVLRDITTNTKVADQPRGSFLDVVLCEKVNGISTKRVRKPSRKAAAGM